MFYLNLLLLITAAFYVKCDIQLIQQPTAIVKPGESLTLTCEVSGYSVTDNSYATAWIRQPAGKALEWIIDIWGGGGIYKKESLKSKFSISKDNSKSTVTLQGNNLQSEDTAVYYCARKYSGDDYFDYWGKGTSVTVTSEQPAQPSPPKSVFPVWQCEHGSDLVNIGCLTRGLTTPDATFKWRDSGDKELTDFTQYPAVRENGGYTLVSHMQVKASDWNSEKQFKCIVNSAGTDLPGIVKKPVVNIQPASLLLTYSINMENEPATFICLAKQYSPTYKFKWIYNKHVDVTKNSSTTVSCESKRTAFSTLELTQDSWSDTTSIECKVLRNNGSVVTQTKYEPDTAEPKVEIIPPSFKDMLIHRSGDLECKTEASDGLISIAWIKGDQNMSAVPTKTDDGKIKLVTRIDYEDWTKGVEYKCEVEHTSFPLRNKAFPYRRVPGIMHCPSVYLLSPTENKDDTVTLTCYVKDFSPKEVVVSWLAGEKLLDDDKYLQKTTSAIEGNNGFSVYSQLIVPIGEWEKGEVYSCRVYHEAIDERVLLITRTIDNKSNTPTLVNLNLNVPNINKSC